MPLIYNSCSQVGDDAEVLYGRNTSNAHEVSPPSSNKRKRICRNVRSNSTNLEVKPVNSDRAKAITQAMCKMIAVDMLSASMVENKGFLDFTTTLEPEYMVPCRRVINNHIRAMYNDVSEEIEEKLETASAFQQMLGHLVL